jgi:hypothetical protein
MKISELEHDLGNIINQNTIVLKEYVPKELVMPNNKTIPLSVIMREQLKLALLEYLKEKALYLALEVEE